MRLPLSFLVILLLLACSTAALATDADILGVVQDESGGMVPGATVTARNVDTGLVRATTTDEQGRYRIVALPAGPYEVTAELPGFQTVRLDGITLTIGLKATINFDLAVAAVTETVTVSGESPIVETATAEVGLTFTTKTIESIPLNGRNPTDLLLLAPGVAVGRQRNGYAIAGALERNNSYTIDGMDNNDENVGGRRVDLQQDVVREFVLISNQFSAEYGR
ncbi:MAG TPA: carboxypeptidase-like regulatory domain-containing protein, partial [Vicinamibacteria bacterium]|nr:carboxypeptidase-like regulatory domain-containing protein [Vicinamibacteria bacterium]